MAVKSVILIIASLTVASLLVGCGNQITDSTNTTTSRPGQAGNQPNQQGPPLYKGVAVSDCFRGLTFRDPDDGHVTATIHLQPAYSGGSLGAVQPSAPCRGLIYRETFDRTFSRMAVVSGQQTDGSQHVGFVDLKTGEFVDVTAKNLGQGFSAHTPRDYNPVFSPNTDDLWYVRDTGEIYSIDLKAFVTRHRATVQFGGLEIGNPLAIGSAGFVVTPGTDQPLAAAYLPNPSGSLAVGHYQGGVGGSSPAPGGLIIYTNFADTLTYNPSATRHSLAVTEKYDCTPLAWVDDSHLICDSSTAPLRNFSWVEVTVNANDSSADAQPLLPDTELHLETPVISPDHSRLAFQTSHALSDYAIYVAPLTGKATPQKLIDLPSANIQTALVEWDR